MRFLSSKDFHRAVILIFQKSPSEAILDYREQPVKLLRSDQPSIFIVD